MISTKELLSVILTTFLFLLVLAGGYYLVLNNPSLQNTIALATTVKPETFTELYFENHLNLTRHTTVNKPHTVTFTIHNLEYKTMNYPYEIYVEDASQSARKTTVLKDIVRLNHDEKRTIAEHFILVDELKRAKVVINLTDKNQEIHYWIGEENK